MYIIQQQLLLLSILFQCKILSIFGFTILSLSQQKHPKNVHKIVHLASSPIVCAKSSQSQQHILFSSFYGDFEDFKNDDEEDDDEDDDDEYIDLDEKAFANFKAKMGGGISTDENNFDLDEEDEEDDDEDYDKDYEGSDETTSQSFSSVDDLINFATSSSSTTTATSEGGETSNVPITDWAKPLNENNNDDMSKILKGGIVLIANPAKFCADFPDNSNNKKTPSPALLSKFGLTLPPPAELGPDRRADLLPVLVMLERHPLRGCHALLMNRRTGYLIGDLEQNQPKVEDEMSGDISNLPPQLGAFMIQPLWFGGTSAGDQSSSSKGLEMLHVCPVVDGATQLTDDGLFWGGDPAQAQDAMNDPSLERIMTGFDFKFFVQGTRWLPLQLEKEIRDGTWIVANVSKEVLFKSRDRLGVKRAKPLWTEIMELLGGEYKDVRDQLYGEEEN